MNPLDNLISSSSAVPGVTPEGLSRGRAALNAAIAAQTLQESPAGRKAAARWFSGLRGKTIIGVAGAAAVAAAVAVIALASTPDHQAGTPQADASAGPTATASAKGAATATPTASASQPTGPVTYSIGKTKIVTAAYVFSQAAHGAQQAPEANVPLVGGWPQAPYWKTVTQMTSQACPGQVQTSTVWLSADGSEVVSSKTTGSVPPQDKSDQLCDPNAGGGTGNATSVGSVPAGVQIGGQIYTWPQFAALPTDPAKLWPILEADSTTGVASEKGEPESDFLFQTIGLLLENDPVSAPMRVALLKDAEKITGISVTGKYTDSLGRTGIVLSEDDATPSNSIGGFVIDMSNGEVLAQVQPDVAKPGCTTTHSNTNSQIICSSGGAEVFISEGPSTTAPSGINTPQPGIQSAPAKPSQ